MPRKPSPLDTELVGDKSFCGINQPEDRLVNAFVFYNIVSVANLEFSAVNPDEANPAVHIEFQDVLCKQQNQAL